MLRIVLCYALILIHAQARRQGCENWVSRVGVQHWWGDVRQVENPTPPLFECHILLCIHHKNVVIALQLRKQDTVLVSAAFHLLRTKA